jgi:hypothetical protein
MKLKMHSRYSERTASAPKRPTHGGSTSGNHDYQSGLEVDIALLLEDAAIEVLEGHAATLEVDRQRVGIAGFKRFGCGFVGLCATEFGEPEMKAFVRHAEEAGALLADALSSIDAEIVITLAHHAPTDRLDTRWRAASNPSLSWRIPTG